MAYYLVIFFSRLICFLPTAVRRFLGKGLGELCWLVVPTKRRKLAIDNLKRSLEIDEQAARKVAKKSVTRFGDMFLEVLCVPKYNPDNVSEYVELTGAENLAKALAYGRGAVLATAHTGNWELLGASLAMHGFPLVAVVQKQTNAAMDRFINEYRTMAGMHVTYKTGVLEMVRLLGQGKIIGLLMDQDAHEEGVFVDFFGRKASTPQGVAALARMKNAPIVPAFITQKPDGTHQAIIGEPVWVQKTKERDRDVHSTTQQLTTIIENHIRLYPHEWFWLHNRWKTGFRHGNS